MAKITTHKPLLKLWASVPQMQQHAAKYSLNRHCNHASIEQMVTTAARLRDRPAAKKRAVHDPVIVLICRECVELIQELDSPVEYIILATFAYEHKIYCAPMSRKFPDAQVWTSPG